MSWFENYATASRFPLENQAVWQYAVCDETLEYRTSLGRQMNMKTRIFPLFALCGLVATSGLAAQNGDAPPVQATVNVNATVPASGAPEFSGRINDVVALVHSGVDKSVVLSYIKTSPGPFQPSADEIIKLRDAGIGADTLTAMMQRGAELRDQALAASSQGTSPAQAPVISDTATGETPTETQTPPLTYSGSDDGSGSTVAYADGGYPYPYYGYPYYSGYYSTAFFYPFPCWFNGLFFAHGCFFPHGGFVHDNFHVHDGFHGGFHGGDIHGGFHGGDIHGGFHGGSVGGFHGGSHGGTVSGFHSGSVSGFHGGSVSGFHGGAVSGGFHSGAMGGGFHGSIGGSFHGGSMGGFHGGMGGGGGFRGGGGGGGSHGGGGGGMRH
jgi:hypothetical protein